jgi:hypothetical protein
MKMILSNGAAQFRFRRLGDQRARPSPVLISWNLVSFRAFRSETVHSMECVMAKRNLQKQKKNQSGQPQPANPVPGQQQGGFFKPVQPAKLPGQAGQADQSGGQPANKPDDRPRDQQDVLIR